jgi:hypothetical protein
VLGIRLDLPPVTGQAIVVLHCASWRLTRDEGSSMNRVLDELVALYLDLQA